MSNKKGKITNHRRVEIPWNDCKQASPSLSILLSLNILIIYNKQKKKKKEFRIIVIIVLYFSNETNFIFIVSYITL